MPAFCHSICVLCVLHRLAPFVFLISALFALACHVFVWCCMHCSGDSSAFVRFTVASSSSTFNFAAPLSLHHHRSLLHMNVILLLDSVVCHHAFPLMPTHYSILRYYTYRTISSSIHWFVLPPVCPPIDPSTCLSIRAETIIPITRISLVMDEIDNRYDR